jgi:DNA modification methylase
MKYDLFGDPIESPHKNALARRFRVPPFSVLNAREGWWQDRKAWWLAMGIQSEVGRGASRPHNQGKDRRLGTTKTRYSGGDCWRAGTAKSYNTGKWMEEHGGGTRGQASGTSVFDPTLCELVYRWFCPPGGQVLDPFAGGSVRGIVAHELGYRYWGCDLRQEQVDANREQAAVICPETPPSWICGDALDEVPKAPLADCVFSCPPYGDLERYSDDPRDLSTMEYHTFIANLKRIVLRCWERLNDNRFACFVVGEFRDKKGHYRNFVGDTVQAFQAAGFRYYNEAVLITAVGSLPIRITKQFQASRKLGKTHQNVLVFVKGDGKVAAGQCVGLPPIT